MDGATLTYSQVTGTSHGVLTFNADGMFSYVPGLNSNGPDSFTFTANDGQLDSNTAMYNITVSPVNDAPVCQNAVLTTDEDTVGTTDPDCTMSTAMS